jgi:hypothetical protein
MKNKDAEYMEVVFGSFRITVTQHSPGIVKWAVYLLPALACIGSGYHTNLEAANDAALARVAEYKTLYRDN